MSKTAPTTIGITRAELTKLRNAAGVLDSIADIRILNPTPEQRIIYSRFLEARQNLKGALALETEGK